jgi:8-amino-7-oxononanoate synthase
MDSKRENHLFFGGTAYLGMPFNVKFRESFIRGMEIYGVNHGASRNNNITLDIFEIAEREAAKRFLAEDAILLSSGYLAAQLLVQYFVASHELIYAPESHPALCLGSPNLPQIIFKDWVEKTIEKINKSNRPCLIISNTLNNLKPNIYDFNWLSYIDPTKEVVLLLDDSHGIGITGKNGEGCYSRISELSNIQTIVIASMAKALGVDAGLIIAKKSIISQLRSSSVYAGSSPPSPGALYAFVNSEEIYHQELKRLGQNMQTFIDLLRPQNSLFYIPNFPVFLLNDKTIAEGLLKNGIYISSFPYPDPQGEKLNRVVLTSVHKTQEIERLARTINELSQ